MVIHVGVDERFSGTNRHIFNTETLNKIVYCYSLNQNFLSNLIWLCTFYFACLAQENVFHIFITFSKMYKTKYQLDSCGRASLLFPSAYARLLYISFCATSPLISSIFVLSQIFLILTNENQIEKTGQVVLNNR